LTFSPDEESMRVESTSLAKSETSAGTIFMTLFSMAVFLYEFDSIILMEDCSGRFSVKGHGDDISGASSQFK